MLSEFYNLNVFNRCADKKNEMKKYSMNSCSKILQICIVSTLLFGCSDKEKLQGVRQDILSSENVGENSEKIAVTAVSSEKEVINKEFSQVGMNATHSYAPLKFSITPREIWSADLDFEAGKALKMIASPVVANDKVFCVDAGGIVYAFDAKTGTQIWRKSITIAGKDGQIGAAIAYGRGKSKNHLIVTSCFAECFSLDPENGMINWRIKLPAPCKGDSITIADGKIFLMCANSSLQVADIDSGKILWSHSGIVSDSIYLGSSGVAVDNGAVYFAYPSGEIFALLAETGAPIWDSSFPKFSLSDASQGFAHPRGLPVVKDGIVYFSAGNRQTIAFDAKTGKRLWIKDYGGICTPIVSGNSIFILDSETLVCLDRFTGNLRWKNALNTIEKYVHRGMILIKDRILVLSSEGSLMFVSIADGKSIIIDKVNSNVSVNPVIADSKLYLLSNDGKISAYQ